MDMSYNTCAITKQTYVVSRRQLTTVELLYSVDIYSA